MEKTRITTAGAILTAGIASLCCIGPIAVGLIGVGSIAAFSVFWEYRPYFIGLTVVLLGLAFYLTYRKREVVCEDGTCKMPARLGGSEEAGGESVSRWSKMTVWLATLLAALAFAFPYISLTHAQEDDPPAIPAVVLKIDGMDCRGCAAGLEATLAHTKGIRKAKVFFDERKGVVQYDPQVIHPERIVELVDETGFMATLVNQKESL